MSGPAPVDTNSSETADATVTRTPSIHPDSAAETPTEASSSTPGLWTLLGLTRGDQWFLGLVCSFGLLALIVFAGRLQGWGVPPVRFNRPPDAAYNYRIDINRATWIEWAQFEGLGEKLAREIVADRETKGPFNSIEDLIRVKGIGPTNLERLRPWLTCETQDKTTSDKDDHPQPGQTGTPPK